MAIPERYRLIVWDFDGTLARLHTDWAALRKRLEVACRLLGLAPTDLRLNSLVSTLAANGHRERALGLVGEAELASKWTPIATAIAEVWCIEGLVHTVFSDNLRSTIERILCREGCFARFATIVGKEDVRHFKPHPDGLDQILARHPAVAGSEVLYIGDTEKDREAALSRNIDFLHINQIQQ